MPAPCLVVVLLGLPLLPELLGQTGMLTAVRPPRPTDRDTQTAVNVMHWWQRLSFDWQRFLVGWCAAFHLLVAFTLTFAPYAQIYNAGTAPVYEIASRYVWAGLFLAAGVASVALLNRRAAWLQLLWWFAVLPLGGTWLTAFVLAVLNGRGSAIGVVVWPFLYGPWIVAGLRLALGKR